MGMIIGMTGLVGFLVCLVILIVRAILKEPDFEKAAYWNKRANDVGFQ